MASQKRIQLQKLVDIVAPLGKVNLINILRYLSYVVQIIKLLIEIQKEEKND
jgi:hypothetical protein